LSFILVLPLVGPVCGPVNFILPGMLVAI